MENSQEPGQNTTEGDSLEAPAGQPNTEPASTTTTAGDGAEPKPPKKKKGSGLFGRFSVYMLLFVLVLIVAGMVVVISYLRSHSTSTVKQISGQTLTQSSLSQLAKSDVTVGDPKQVLNVQSNAVFAGQVLIQSDLQVAGKLSLGGTLSLTGITVSGTSDFADVQINKNLALAGDAAIQGQLTVQKSINVNGGGTFNGPISAPQVTASNLQLNGDLVLTHHISAGGVNPGRTNGAALGSGGTASVSGSDTAGSITINTGGGAAPGCLVTINFANKFNATPHVVISPVGSAAGSSGYYVNRDTSSFSVCANSPPSNQSFGFDYIVFD